MSSPHAMEMSMQKQLKELPGNQLCCDCGAPQPSWASVSYECSGRHRSLGVHLSFVRSVTMDAWSEKQLRAMQAGGNAKMNEFFRKYDADKLPIVQKYNTAVAAMYRDMIIAARDGGKPPTDIAPYQAEIDADNQRRNGGGTTTPGSTGSGGGDHSNETPVERELRMRAEAQERMRAKFGTGGMKGQSVNNTPQYNSISSDSGPSSRSGGAGGGSNSADEIFGVDLAAANQRISAFAGSAFSKLSAVAKVTGSKVAEGTSAVSKRVQETHITEKFSGAVTSVSAAVTDPNLLNNVSKGATNFWNKATVVGSGLWSQATATAKTLAADIGGATGVPPPHGGFAEFREDEGGGASSPASTASSRPPVGSGRSSTGGVGSRGARPPSTDGSERETPSSSSSGRQLSGAGATAAESKPNDDDAWLAEQVSAVQRNAAGSRSGKVHASSSSAAALSTEWTVDGWDEPQSTAAAAAAPEPVKAAATTTAVEASLGNMRLTPSSSPQSSSDAAVSSSGAGNVSNSSSSAAGEVAEAGKDNDDFFASFGLK